MEKLSLKKSFDFEKEGGSKKNGQTTPLTPFRLQLQVSRRL